MKPVSLRHFIFLIILSALLAACSAAATEYEPVIETPEPAAEEIVKTVEVEVEKTAAPAAEEPGEVERTPTTRPTPTVEAQPAVTPEILPIIPPEEHIVELEWPGQMQTGESNNIRLMLIPTADGYAITQEYAENQVESRTVHIPRVEGYELWAAGSLTGTGFTIDPAEKQEQWLPADQAVTWRWSVTPLQAGMQRLVVALWLHWKPVDRFAGNPREYVAYSKSLDIQVDSFLGLDRSQALAFGAAGLFLGSSLSLAAVTLNQGKIRRPLHVVAANPSLQLETREGIELQKPEAALLSALFQRYKRLVIESEFLSGYSGARTLLCLPVRANGRADAFTIAKIGETGAIIQEYNNYETFVKDTLPPMTARIQHIPVTVAAQGKSQLSGLAALQYTFIGEQGIQPASLRQALLQDPRPELFLKLFESFGPNWWMQRRPYTYRLSQEYDRLLPTHVVLAPLSGRPLKPVKTLQGNLPAGKNPVQLGDLVSLDGFRVTERKPHQGTLSLEGQPEPGQAAMRLRWCSLELPRQAVGQVIATRETLLLDLTRDLELFDLPNPLQEFPNLLGETVIGSQSIIHGDLNLENILLGPGDFLWLIDFAQTREGPPLFDFAHLEADLIAHVFAPRIEHAADFLSLLQGKPPQGLEMMAELARALDEVASRCLVNASRPHEWLVARKIALIGALKFANLDQRARQYLYLAAAAIPL
jgi:hypothetical protein